MHRARTCMPAIIQPSGTTRSRRQRRWASGWCGTAPTLGMSQKEAAAEIGVDQGTPARWEREMGGYVTRASGARASGFSPTRNVVRSGNPE
jgi:hypothetical protein